MTTDLNRMRRAFASAAIWCGWSAADQADIGATIKAVIDSGDEAAIAWWSGYLVGLAGWDYLGQQCRAAEARMKAEAARLRASA